VRAKAIGNSLVEKEVCFRLEHTSFGDKDGGLGSEFMIVTVYVLEPGKNFHICVMLDPGPEFPRQDTRVRLLEE
jgi:hypothetical protein